jgi:hypothetical protein
MKKQWLVISGESLEGIELRQSVCGEWPEKIEIAIECLRGAANNGIWAGFFADLAG